MSEGHNTDNKLRHISAAWFQQDPVANEIRNICGRIINTYRQYMNSGD